MRTTRSLLVGLTATALLGLPGVAVASPALTGSEQVVTQLAPRQHHTRIRYLDFAHIQAAGLSVHVRGQVVGSSQGQRGAIAGASVKLYRQLVGNSNWLYLGTKRTGPGQFPQFNFETTVVQNAHYKIVFAGTALFAPSQEITRVDAHRSFNAVITDGKGAATLHGHVDPYYTHKAITLEKRACAACKYVPYKDAVTGNGGAYSFSLPAPQAGRWWWRLAIPSTPAFIRSYSGTFSTELN